jgi:hypothetical protein
VTKPDDQYGLLIERVNRYGTEYIEVRVARRDNEHEYPIGCPSDGDNYLGYGTPKHMLGLVVDGLGMYGFVSDGEFRDPDFIGADIEFREVHSISERKLKSMTKAIRKVNARIEKDEAREPGDKYMALAKALKLSFAVERIKRNGNSDDWRWMSVEEGRNRYRALIEEAVAEAVARKAA